MKYFYSYIFILSLFIIGISYWKTIHFTEEFSSTKQNIVLLGDSIFKNNNYVHDGKSVDQLLIERTSGKSLCLAVDNAKILQVYDQYNKIPDELNSSSTIIFLSVGGNDILSKIEIGDPVDDNVLNTLFDTYKELVKSIQIKLPNVHIVLCDLYYPNNVSYQKYHPIIRSWNNMIYNFSRESKNHIDSVFMISSILTKPEDFTLEIEPSSIGSQKVVDTILSSY
jgi:hypothetical protein